MPRHQGTNNAAQFLSQLDRNIQASERELEKMERYVKGLRLARENVAGFILEDARAPRVNGTAYSRIDALKEVLAAAPEPATIDQIVEGLKSRGVVTDRTGIASSLQYAKRKGLAKNVDRGRWALVTSRAA